jgi:hypothetical protein
MDTALVLSDSTNVINGEIENNQDTDLFSFSLLFTQTITIEVLQLSAALDMNLLFFNALGQALAGDDDDNNDCTATAVLGSLDSCLTLNLAAGDYFFGVGDNNIGAFESLVDFTDRNDFFDNDNGILSTPTTEILGLIGPEGGPNAENDFGFYKVNLYRSSVDVPEPSTLAIFALGMIGLASRRFKKQS